MTREEAINEIKSWDFLEGKEIEAIHTLIPDLAESEDKRMVVKIARTLSFAAAHNLIIDYDELIAMQNWLEKQKNLDKMIVVSPEVWDKAIADAFENGKKEGEKQKEQKVLPGFDGLTPEEKMNHPLYLEGFDVGRDVQKVFDEQKPEWGEEDKRKLNRIYEILGQAADERPFGSSKRIIGDKEAVELQDFIKSLRPSWKPTEEQMGALERCIDYLDESDNDDFGIMLTLYEQLEELGVREEPEYYQHFDPDC